MEGCLVAALGSHAQRLFDLLDPWCDLIVADGGYPVRVTWPNLTVRESSATSLST